MLALNRLALDLKIEGATAIQIDLLHADLWNWIDPTSTLHGRPWQLFSFGIVSRGSTWAHLRIQSLDQEFSLAIIQKLATSRSIQLGMQTYLITEVIPLPLDNPSLIQTHTPVVIRTLRTPGTHQARQCLTQHDVRYLTYLQDISRAKLIRIGFLDEDLPETLITPIEILTQRHWIHPNKSAVVGSIGIWALHGTQEVRQAMILAGIGAKTGIGCGFASPYPISKLNTKARDRYLEMVEQEEQVMLDCV